jgi:hypothetical protein
MRRWIFLLFSILLLVLTWWLRGNTDRFVFVVPSNREVLYASSFTDGRFAEDWSLEDRRGYLSGIVEDRIQLTIEDAVFLTPSGPDALRTMNRFSFGDFDYRVQTTALEGPDNNSFGVIFRQTDPATYYIFYISSDGYYSVWRELPTGYIALSNWIPTDVIRQGTDGAVNDIRVVAQGGTFQFYINDMLVQVCVPNNPDGESTYVESRSECVDGTMQDTLVDNTIANGQLGIIVSPFASGQLTIAFDNALVLSPE